MVVDWVKVDEVVPYEKNARLHSPKQVKQIAQSIDEFGFTNPLLIDEKNTVLAGHGRLLAAKHLKLDKVPCIQAKNLTETQKKAYILADNKIAENSSWDNGMLLGELKTLEELGVGIEFTGFSPGDFAKLKYTAADAIHGILREKYIEPPFSLLDSRSKNWLDRRRKWSELINDNTETREDLLIKSLSEVIGVNATSVFDATLAEVICHWFSTSTDTVFDPFAGDTVIGFVAGFLGREFKGIELRKDQSELNQSRCDAHELNCEYFTDTCVNMDKYIPDNSVDLVFSCPPYADLEQYSDLEEDVSNMTHEQFFETMKLVCENAVRKLKNDRFFVLVLSDVRDKKGAYIGLVSKIIEMVASLENMSFHNDCVLLNSVGSARLRANNSMTATRKVSRMHQNVLVFLKGDAKKAAKRLNGSADT